MKSVIVTVGHFIWEVVDLSFREVRRRIMGFGHAEDRPPSWTVSGQSGLAGGREIGEEKKEGGRERRGRGKEERTRMIKRRREEIRTTGVTLFSAFSGRPRGID